MPFISHSRLLRPPPCCVLVCLGSAVVFLLHNIPRFGFCGFFCFLIPAAVIISLLLGLAVSAALACQPREMFVPLNGTCVDPKHVRPDHPPIPPNPNPPNATHSVCSPNNNITVRRRSGMVSQRLEVSRVGQRQVV